MDLSFSPAEQAFQAAVRAFLAESLSEETKRAWALTPTFLSEPDITLPWQPILAPKGWAAPRGW